MNAVLTSCIFQWDSATSNTLPSNNLVRSAVIGELNRTLVPEFLFIFMVTDINCFLSLAMTKIKLGTQFDLVLSQHYLCSVI